MDRSAYPPECVTGEAHTPVRIEAAERPHHANVTFADQVFQWQAIAAIDLNNSSNEAKLAPN